MRSLAWNSILHIPWNCIFHLWYFLTWVNSRSWRIMRNWNRRRCLSRLNNIGSPRYLSCLHHDPMIWLNVLNLIRTDFNRKWFRDHIELGLLLRSMVWMFGAVILLVQNTVYGHFSQLRTHVLFWFHDNNRAFLNKPFF